MTRKEAREHMQFVRDLLYPGCSIFCSSFFESSLTAGYNGPLRVKSAGKTRNHTHLHYPGRNDPDRYVSSTDHGNAGAGILDLLPEAMPSPGGFIRA